MGLMKLNLKTRYTTAKNTIGEKTRPARKRISTFINNHPFKALFGLLGLLILLIILSNLLNKPKIEEKKAEPKPKKVEIYQIGSSPRITVQAQIEKSGVVTIAALSPGIVQQIYTDPGMEVTAGQSLLYMSSTYQGGNVPALQLSLAAAQLKNADETYDTQRELIAKQREIATKTEENADELRDISAKSKAETQEMIDLNDQILANVNAAITAGVNVQENTALKGQYLAANAQLRTALRNTEYAVNEDKPPTALGELQKDIVMKQLDIQEKSLTLSREVTRLQYQIAAVGAQAMQPSAPFHGTVQRIFVKPGQSVNPGTPLMVLSQAVEEDPIVAIAYVPADVARKVSYYEPSTLTIGNKNYDTYPTFITRDAIQGSLYGVYFPIPENYSQYVTDAGYINVQIPVGAANTSAAIPYIPIDSVYQTQDESYLFVASNGVAKSKKIKLGPVVGRYVEVEDGIKSGDRIILNRDIVTGDKVAIR
ncbi:hypothetical protein BH09PAT2_BH09PAT2_05550 [soil metagenome]